MTFKKILIVNLNYATNLIMHLINFNLHLRLTLKIIASVIKIPNFFKNKSRENPENL